MSGRQKYWNRLAPSLNRSCATLRYHLQKPCSREEALQFLAVSWFLALLLFLLMYGA